MPIAVTITTIATDRVIVPAVRDTVTATPAAKQTVPIATVP